jgi:hypothetical protein
MVSHLLYDPKLKHTLGPSPMSPFPVGIVWHYIDSLHCFSAHPEPEVHLGTSYVVPVVDLFTLSGPLGPSFWSLQQPKFSIMVTLGLALYFFNFDRKNMG